MHDNIWSSSSGSIFTQSSFQSDTIFHAEWFRSLGFWHINNYNVSLKSNSIFEWYMIPTWVAVIKTFYNTVLVSQNRMIVWMLMMLSPISIASPMTMNSIFCYLLFIICTRYLYKLGICVSRIFIFVYGFSRSSVLFHSFLYYLLKWLCLSHCSYCDWVWCHCNYMQWIKWQRERESKRKKTHRIETETTNKKQTHCKCRGIDRSSDTLSLG